MVYSKIVTVLPDSPRGLTIAPALITLALARILIDGQGHTRSPSRGLAVGGRNSQTDRNSHQADRNSQTNRNSQTDRNSWTNTSLYFSQSNTQHAQTALIKTATSTSESCTPKTAALQEQHLRDALT